MAAPALVWLVVGGALLAMSRRGSSSASGGRSGGGGHPASLAGATLVPTRATGGSDPVEWTRTRWAAFRDVLIAQGMDATRAGQVAAAVVAHWARETGWNRAEWNYNVGNIKAFNGWTGLYQRLADNLLYRAYASLRDGVADTLGLLQSSRYRPAWEYLTSTGDGHGWYDRIMRAGWHPWSEVALREYDSIRNRVRERVGV